MTGLAIILLLCCCSLSSAQTENTSADPQNPTEETQVTERLHPCCLYWQWNWVKFNKCCKEIGTPHFCPTEPCRKGCHYKRRWYPVGAIMEINAKKCYYIKCYWKWNGYPSIQHVGEDGCNCCLIKVKGYQDMLVADGEYFTSDGRKCVCRNGIPDCKK